MKGATSYGKPVGVISLKGTWRSLNYCQLSDCYYILMQLTHNNLCYCHNVK